MENISRKKVLDGVVKKTNSNPVEGGSNEVKKIEKLSIKESVSGSRSSAIPTQEAQARNCDALEEKKGAVRREELENKFTIQDFRSKFVKHLTNKEDIIASIKEQKNQKVKGKTVITNALNSQIISDNEFAIELCDEEELTSEEVEVLNKLGGKFNGAFKYWSFNLEDYHTVISKLQSSLKGRSIKQITSYPIELICNAKFQKISIKDESQKEEIVLDYTSDGVRTVKDLPYTLRKALYSYQKKGIEFAISNHGRCIIGDEMGLGKTIQAISLSYLYKENWPVMILCPASLKYNWKNELLKWLKDDVSEQEVQVLNASKDTIDNAAKFVILSYDLSISTQINKKIEEKSFEFIIADEAHYLKNSTARRTAVNIPLMKKSKRLLLLSGTPILAKPEECFQLLSAVRPDLFNNYISFCSRYCIVKVRAETVYFSGTANSKELNFILSKVMIRRLKSDITSELPDKIRQRVEISVESSLQSEIFTLIHKNENYKKYMKMNDETAKAYETFLRSLEKQGNKVSEVKSIKKQETFNTSTVSEEDSSESEEKKYFIQAYKLTGEAKLDGIKAYISELYEKIDEKIIIFAHHITVLDGIEEQVKSLKVGYIRLDGSTKSSEKTELVNFFQTNHECRFAILSITACCIGITLSSASTVVMAEIYFTPSIMLQAEDRAHRIGQKKSVNIVYLFGPTTIDEIIYPRIREKNFVVTSILDDKLIDIGLQENNKAEVISMKSSSDGSGTFTFKDFGKPQNKNLDLKEQKEQKHKEKKEKEIITEKKPDLGNQIQQNTLNFSESFDDKKLEANDINDISLFLKGDW